MGFNVIIKNQDQEAKTIADNENADTVMQLKTKYAAVADMVVESMRFVCGGNECVNEDTLDTAGITADAPVMVVYQVPGGN